MDKEALIEQMLNELGEAKLSAYKSEGDKKLEESNVVWSSEYTYDEEFYKEQYQEYIDNYIPAEPKSYEAWLEMWQEDMEEMAAYEDFEFNIADYSEEELKEMYDDYVANYQDPGPVDYDKWQFSFAEEDSYNQSEVLSENFSEQIYPMIERQLNHKALILIGSVGRWNGTSDGAKVLNDEEQQLRNIMSDYDEIIVTEEDDKQLEMEFVHHDASHHMKLYTLPEDVLELAKAVDYEQEVKDRYDEEFIEKQGLDYLIKEEFLTDIYDLDAAELIPHTNLLKPIINTL